ncbi:hypothetical protein [Flavobacterium sp. NKUCC04_CG]|uniref:hypothetical protein n=1 Tax=Flavobacterium sp. NKUCC04_CG TaxID=2842121 RepID=UPI001C5BD085|nr:hypothetical protein [Flavobacterium sp. NKUCC04_CG]MBW3519901.1 hypothetical protein [Flavobacterium sp. NKUCC04_CG]
MKINPLTILVIGLALMVLGYILKSTAVLNNHLITIAGLILIAASLASLVFNRLRK